VTVLYTVVSVCYQHKGRTESCWTKQWTYHESDVPHLLRAVLDISSVMCNLLQTQCEQPASDSLYWDQQMFLSVLFIVCSQNTVHFLTTVQNSANFKLALIIQLCHGVVDVPIRQGDSCFL